ncbi:MAG: hypothetical protein H6983_05910 [Ectothiorhodospiraceae bacterium]|nr:hypothetical protein [Ectothiorhodospiraceae bacterium]
MEKKFGIRVTLPAGDPMAAPHLLGPGWESFRWYDSAEARDHALAEMQRRVVYYRRGDQPSQILEQVERA